MDARELVAALERVAAGEREVLRLMAEGLTDLGIAERLWVTPTTVETPVRYVLRKLDVPAGVTQNRRVQAVWLICAPDNGSETRRRRDRGRNLDRAVAG